MRVYVQYQERGDITLIWTEEDESQGHVFTVPQSGYYQTEVDLPAMDEESLPVRLAAIPARFRVSRRGGRAVLVEK